MTSNQLVGPDCQRNVLEIPLHDCTVFSSIFGRRPTPGCRGLNRFCRRLSSNTYPRAKGDQPLQTLEPLNDQEIPESFGGICPSSRKIQNGRSSELRHFPMNMFNLMESRTEFLQRQHPEFLQDRNSVTMNKDGLVDPVSMDNMEGL